MVRRIYRESCGWKCSSSQGRTRDFFSWISFRAARKSGIGQALYLYALPEGPKLRHLHEDQENKTRAPGRKLLAQPYLGHKKFGELMTADHKVLREGCESRNNHRYAVVVQIFASQWIRSYPCKTITFQETEKSLQKFLEPMRKPKVIHTNNSWAFGKACEDLSWNHCTSTHRSETNGIAERALRRIKEGTSAVLLQSGLDERWWAGFMECHWYLRDIQDLLSDWKNLTTGNSANHSKDQ